MKEAKPNAKPNRPPSIRFTVKLNRKLLRRYASVDGSDAMTWIVLKVDLSGKGNEKAFPTKTGREGQRHPCPLFFGIIGSALLGCWPGFGGLDLCA